MCGVCMCVRDIRLCMCWVCAFESLYVCVSVSSAGALFKHACSMSRLISLLRDKVCLFARVRLLLLLLLILLLLILLILLLLCYCNNVVK